MNVETRKTQVSKPKAWLSAMRLRTLPLALASTITGAFLAINHIQMDWLVFALTALTTILLQINSNLANDYGDFEQGVDNETRIGPQRAMQSGAITKMEMRRAIGLFSGLSLVSGCILLWISDLSMISKLVLLFMGLAAIYASIKYTAGKNPYGYRGLGDVSVLLFFGILGVVGAHYLQTGAFDPWILLPAIGIGALSAGVLNVNNTRDIDSDRASGKMTLAVKLGPDRARLYHVLVLAVGLDAMLIYAWVNFDAWLDWLFIAAYPLFLLNMFKVYTTRDSELLDPWLKQLALTAFLMALLIAASQIVT
ncbi:MAG: 1,4-dihydroxy-2-naphthoate polyprenyltransferase [Flavobacteriales bacterium]